MISTVNKIKEYAKTINFTVVDNSFITKTSKIKVTCPDNHTKEVNYTNWKKAVNKCLDCPQIVAKRERITIEYLQQLFTDKGFELLDTEYIDCDTKLQYKCKCGQINSSILANFRKMTYGCNICAHKNIVQKLLLPFNEVTMLFTNIGYKILIKENEYIGSTMPIKYECNMGHVNETTLMSLRGGHGCSICSGNKKLTYDFVKGEFEAEDFIMVSQDYVNARTPMDVVCSKGHNINITYDEFSSNNSSSKGCAHCAGCVKHTYENVKKSFEDENYVLVSDNYVNAHSHLDFICPKGHKHYIAYTHFVSGKRCGVCAESRGEMAIRKYLSDNDIEYEREFRYDDCKDSKSLPFDFYVADKFLIEYDGIQHFNFTDGDYFGGEKAFEQRQKHDIIKTNYCILKKIPLLRISYNHLDKIPEIISDYMKKLKKNKSLIHLSDPSLYKYLTV